MIYHPFIDFNCNLCNSSNIIETSQGYVCIDCGLVLEIQKIVYHRPYNIEKLQNKPNLTSTRIGTISELKNKGYPSNLTRLKILNRYKTNEQAIYSKAKAEIYRILTSLGLKNILKNDIFIRFKSIYEQLQPQSKFRNPEKLIPCIIYLFCKEDSIIIDEGALLEISKITKKEFNAFRLQYNQFFPKRTDRDRIRYILNQIFQIFEMNALPISFYYESRKILIKLWKLIKNTTDRIIAGVVSSITSLCYYPEQVSVSTICKHLHISICNVQYQVKINIFQRLKLSGFTTLKKSVSILRKITKKLLSIPKKKKRKKISIPIRQVKIHQHIKIIKFLFQINRKTEKRFLHHQFIILFNVSHKKIFICLYYPKIKLRAGEIFFIGKGPPKK